MKRIVTLLAVSILIWGGGGVNTIASASDNFGELNVGVNFADVMLRAETSRVENVVETKNGGFGIVGEYLILGENLDPGLDFLKFGIGLGYTLSSMKMTYKPRGYKETDEVSFNFVPTYFTLQVNPLIKSDNEYSKGVFIKGNIGYGQVFIVGNKWMREYKNVEGDLCYGFEVGLETPFDLTVGVSCNFLSYSYWDGVTYWDKDGTRKAITQDCLRTAALTFGYKFKI